MKENSLNYAQRNSEEFIAELSELLRIKSISTDPQHSQDMAKAAFWLETSLKKAGCQSTQVYQTPGHPIVFGEYRSVAAHAQTVLIYGHYDVQPVDPLELWNTDPFTPKIIGDYLFARGASDMKGQVMASIKAVKSVLSQNENFPLNLKFILEGEEEIGSPSMPDFLKIHRDILQSDIALNPDAGMLSIDTPAITYGLRGLAYFELTVTGPHHDLHSGQYGGAIHNPAQVLCEIIAKMHDEHGRITLPDFYKTVKQPGKEERTQLAALRQDDSVFLQQTGVQGLWGEESFSAIERIGIRPTLEVNGMVSGFTGSGAKTIIPSTAMAKISMRLVPDQEPSAVRNQLEAFLKENMPKTVQWELLELAGGPASLVNLDRPEVQAMTDALAKVWEREPVFLRAGGSIPIVAQMQSCIGLDSILTGFGLPDDNIHAPNERLHLPTWRRGIDAIIHFLYNLL
ncbi:MAG: dipeptidase [Anaerolineaceae bacterium]|nr:dipeptidase [Anaerolineaceae bacterium]